MLKKKRSTILTSGLQHRHEARVESERFCACEAPCPAHSGPIPRQVAAAGTPNSTPRQPVCGALWAPETQASVGPGALREQSDRHSPKQPGGVKPSAGGATEAHMTPTMQTTSGRVVTIAAAKTARSSLASRASLGWRCQHHTRWPSLTSLAWPGLTSSRQPGKQPRTDQLRQASQGVTRGHSTRTVLARGPISR